MQYRFVAYFQTWLPYEPNEEVGDVTNSNLFVNECLIPRLASVGGVQAFAKFLGDQNMIQNATYADLDDKTMMEHFQRQLVAHGYPKDIIDILTMFETESIASLSQQFARQAEDIRQRNDNNWLPMDKNYDLRLKASVQMIDLQQFGYDFLHKNSREGKYKTGYIRWLPNLPRNSDGAVDTGKFYLIVS